MLSCCSILNKSSHISTQKPKLTRKVFGYAVTPWFPTTNYFLLKGLSDRINGFTLNTYLVFDFNGERRMAQAKVLNEKEIRKVLLYIASKKHSANLKPTWKAKNGKRKLTIWPPIIFKSIWTYLYCKVVNRPITEHPVRFRLFQHRRASKWHFQLDLQNASNHYWKLSL